jgi:hypothetical protein
MASKTVHRLVDALFVFSERGSRRAEHQRVSQAPASIDGVIVNLT